jgi:hypothetical protein
MYPKPKKQQNQNSILQDPPTTVQWSTDGRSNRPKPKVFTIWPSASAIEVFGRILGIHVFLKNVLKNRPLSISLRDATYFFIKPCKN